MHGLCTVIVCTIGLHVPIGVMVCTLITCLWSMLLLKQPWVWTQLVSRYFLVHTTSMSCGTRLTAVAVGLSIVALNDEEVKTPASMACSHNKECYCCELPEAIFIFSYICIGVRMLIICPGCNVVFPLQILRTPPCFRCASSSLTNCVYIITHLVCAFVSVTKNTFTNSALHTAPHTSCVLLLMLSFVSLRRMENLPSRLLSVEGT